MSFNEQEYRTARTLLTTLMNFAPTVSKAWFSLADLINNACERIQKESGIPASQWAIDLNETYTSNVQEIALAIPKIQVLIEAHRPIKTVPQPSTRRPS